MALDGFVGLAAGAVGLGLLHGVEPGHGWPVAASYALDRANTWAAGLLASTILGVGHLVSSIAMVAVFFWAKAYFDLTQVGWMNQVAGVLLILLGLRELRLYRRGEADAHARAEVSGQPADADGSVDDPEGPARPSKFDTGPGQEPAPDGAQTHTSRVDHAAEHAHTEGHGQAEEHAHAHGHGHAEDHAHGHGRDDQHGHSHDGHGGVVGTLLSWLPVDVVPDQPTPDEATDRGILGITAFAFALGFAHEEEFEIIAICMASSYCLELMLVYALAVVVGLVALTLLLVAGYEHSEERVEAYTPYLPLVSATVLVGMGVGFLAGLF